MEGGDETVGKGEGEMEEQRRREKRRLTEDQDSIKPEYCRSTKRTKLTERRH